MSAAAVGSLLWVKADGSPWWPAVVLDPSAAAEALQGAEMPEGCDIVVQYYAPASIGFANSRDPATVLPFDDDPARVGEPSVAHAVEEVRELMRRQRAQFLAADDRADEDDLLLGGGESSATSPREERQQHGAGGRPEGSRREKKKEKKEKKKDKKEKKKEKRKTKEKKSRKERRRRDDSASDSDPSSAASDDSDDDDNARAKRKRREARGHRQTLLDDHNLKGAGGGGVFAAAPPSSKPDGKAARKPIPDDSLLFSAHAELSAAIAACDEAAATDVLSRLTHFSVTAKQLAKTRIGALIGSQLIGDDAPFPLLRELAHGLLAFWFVWLPQPVRSRLESTEDVDAASVRSVESGGSPAHTTLDAAGVEIERAFRTAEIEEVGADIDAVASLAAELEHALKALGPAVAETHITALKKPANSALRLRLLRRELAAEDFAGLGEEDLLTPEEAKARAAVLEEHRRELHGDTEPENVTTRYACPSCQRTRATYNENFLDVQGDLVQQVILVCLECGHTWREGEADGGR